MNWYRLEAVRDALRLDHGAELAPGLIRRRGPHVEVWRRTVGEQVFTTLLSYESEEFLVPEESLLAAVESLGIRPARGFLENVKARGGLWTGPNPRS